jgi:hypothetical protein
MTTVHAVQTSLFVCLFIRQSISRISESKVVLGLYVFTGTIGPLDSFYLISLNLARGSCACQTTITGHFKKSTALNCSFGNR